MERVSEALLAPGALESLLESLSPNERSILYSIMFHGRRPAIIPENHGRFMAVSGGKTPTESGRHPFWHLHQEGLLYRFVHPFHRSSGLYVVPSEILEQLSNILIEKTIARCGVSVSHLKDQPPEGHNVLTNDVLTLLLLAAPEGIPLTQQYVPFRKVTRQLEALLPQIDLAEEILCEPFWMEDRYPSLRLALLFLFTSATGLFLSGNSAFEVASGAFEWIRGSYRRWFPLWMDLLVFYQAPSTLLRQFVAELIRKLPEGVGLDPKALLAWSDPFVGKNGFLFDELLAEDVAGLLWKLVYMGVLEVVREEDEEPLLVRTKLGTSILNGEEIEPCTGKRFFVVQPNFDLLCDPYSLAGAGGTVARFTQVGSVDRTFLLRFTRDSVNRGLRNKHSLASCCSALQGAATQPVPENVLKTMQEWSKGYHRVHLRPALLIHVEDEEQAEALRGSSVFELVREEINPTTFSASIEDLRDLRKRLSKLKMDLIDETVSTREKYKEPEQELADWSDLTERKETPEYSPVGFYEPVEEALRAELKSREIVPPGLATDSRDPVRDRRDPTDLRQIRAAIRKGMLEDKLVRLTVCKGNTGETETRIVYPICWGHERGQHSFYASDDEEEERLWRIDEILDAKAISDSEVLSG
ncbi:MAG: hypothetical protein ABIH23_08775 [bacterium]